MNVALVYDRVNKWGGAERVLLALHKLFPKAPLYTSVYNPKNAAWANDFTITTSFLQNFPFAPSHHELFPLLMPIAFESFTFDEYDVVISVTSEAAKGIITKSRTKHICYCLTPTRYLWSGHDTYFPNSLVKTLSLPAISYLRRWDKIAAIRPDVFVAISKEVKGRIKEYYNRDSSVIYPAVTLGEKGKDIGERKNDSSPVPLHPSPFFLVVSRLSKFTSYKRVDLAVEACTALKLPLKIVGSGNLTNDLKQIAGPTVEFLGNLTDAELIGYYKQCKALIFPGIEDFGLAIVEAQLFGKPVIAFRGGGAVETIIEGTTGYFFSEQTKESLMQALQKFSDYSFEPKAAKKQAQQFNVEKFNKDFLALVNKVI